MQFDPFVPRSLVATEVGTALATPGQATLLQLSTSFNSSSPDPGQIVGAIQPSPSVSAEAYWNNVAAIVTGQAGQCRRAQSGWNSRSTINRPA